MIWGLGFYRMIRLRQIALVARNLDSAIDDVRRNLDVDVCFRDPGVAEFGLHNALFRIGDQFLEIVSPVRDETTAGRLLDRMGGDCGYMAIFEVDDLDARMNHMASHGVRTVWRGDFPDIRGRHLHPKDTGGTLVSIDQPATVGDWRWGGPTWRNAPTSTFASSIDGFTLASCDPQRLATRWKQLNIDCSAEFADLKRPVECLASVRLSATDGSHRGKRFTLCGVDFDVD